MVAAQACGIAFKKIPFKNYANISDKDMLPTAKYFFRPRSYEEDKHENSANYVLNAMSDIVLRDQDRNENVNGYLAKLARLGRKAIPRKLPDWFKDSGII